jgi:hypothetical protein
LGNTGERGVLVRRSSGRHVVGARLAALVSTVLFLILGSLAIVDAAPATADTAAPTVATVSPDIGPVTGGATVLVTGTGFVDGSTSVAFGPTPAADVVVTSDTTLSATVPANVGGSYDVTVTIPDTDLDAVTSTLTSAPTPADLYAYGPPTVTAVIPGAGPVAGGNTVTVTGTSFVSGATVSFGTTAATDVTVTSATTMTATVPATTDVGAVDVTVTTPSTDGGTSPTWVNDLYAYGPPTAASLSPITGPAATATTVTITGTNFSPGETVDFGATPGTNVVVWGSTVLTVEAPTTLSGGASVTVTNAVASTAPSVAMQFAAGPPIVAGVSPAAGPPGGGGIVTITGDGFVEGTSVAFGGVPAAGVTVTSPTSLQAGAPSGNTGSVDITVTTPEGASPISTADLYAYGVPVVSAVTPDTATVAGGTQVTVAGSGFVPGVVVSFGSVPGSAVLVNATGSSLEVTSPAGTAGSVDLTVTSAAGTSLTSINDLFAYGAPVVNSVAPDAGALAGGDDVIVAGNGFVTGVTVYFGDQPSTSATVLAGGTGLYAVAPPGTPGAVDITVSTDQGTSATSLHDAYFYGSPAITSVTPGTGSSGGGTTVTITGTGFAPDSTVSFGLQPAASGSINSSTSITAVAPAGGIGIIPVRVSTPAGISPLTPADNFEYDDQLQISCAAPPAISTSCNSIDMPSVNLQGEWQNASAPANTLYVTDDRSDATNGWSLSAYVEPSADNPNSWCDGFSGFCNSTAGSDSASPNAKIPADYLSLTNVGCAPAAGNSNPSPLAGTGGNFPVGQGAVALCTAAAGTSAGSFKVDATFSLQVPPWVYAGQYEATVVFLVM